jgi:hypothetical protein
MSPVDTEHNLLFGLLALQNGLIDQAQLVAAFQSWTRDKGRTLADHLVASGRLEPAHRPLLEGLAAAHLARHGGDPERSLAAVSVAPSIRRSLAAVADAPIGSTLVSLVFGPDGDGDPDRPFDCRGHFFAATAEAMRRILIDRARDRRRLKRGGGRRRVRIDLDRLLAEPPDDCLLARDEALTALAREDPGAAALVKLRAFAGLTLGPSAELLGIGRPTADRDWAYARAWLCHALSGTGRPREGEKNPADSDAPGARTEH